MELSVKPHTKYEFLSKYKSLDIRKGLFIAYFVKL